MAVRIRMTRMGKKHSPFYRIGAYESRNRRDGRSLEILGWYNPLNAKEEEQLKVNLERINYWISVGAKPSPKTMSLLKKAGVDFAPKAKTTTKAKKNTPKNKKEKK